jgi:hypothetical protein
VVSELALTDLKIDDSSLDGGRLLKADSLLEDQSLGLKEMDGDLLEREELQRTLEEETELLIKETEDTILRGLPTQKPALPPLD